MVPRPSADLAIAEEPEGVVRVARYAQHGVERRRGGEDPSLEQRAHEGVEIRGRGDQTAPRLRSEAMVERDASRRQVAETFREQVAMEEGTLRIGSPTVAAS